jgi:hypothetical protein
MPSSLYQIEARTSPLLRSCSELTDYLPLKSSRHNRSSDPIIQLRGQLFCACSTRKLSRKPVTSGPFGSLQPVRSSVHIRWVSEARDAVTSPPSAEMIAAAATTSMDAPRYSDCFTAYPLQGSGRNAPLNNGYHGASNASSSDRRI